MCFQEHLVPYMDNDEHRIIVVVVVVVVSLLTCQESLGFLVTQKKDKINK